MNIRYIPTWLGLLLTLYLVTACDRVYDDLSGCLGNTIVFSYLADDNQEHLQEYVDGIDVFIFDAKGEVLVERHHSGEGTAAFTAGGHASGRGL